MDREILALADIPPEAYDCVDAYENNNNEYMEALLDVLCKVPEAVRRMEAQKIPYSIIKDTFADIGLWVRRCKRQQGYFGLADPSPDWLKNHLACKIFRVGRFQCIPRYFPADWNVRFYRNNETGRVIAVTAGDVDFRKDGQINGTSGIFADADGFKGYFTEKQLDGKATAEGVIISPAGHAENKSIVLDLKKWTNVLKEGMPVLELHIPVDGDFTIETCRNTLNDMVNFAKVHEAALTQLTGVKSPLTAFTLSSWLLNAQLDGILPETSRLVQHLRQYYLLPVLSGEDNELFWIFDGKKIDLDNISPEEQQTSLQRRIVQFIRDGGKVRYNRGVILFKDAPEFGNELYRRDQ